MKELFEFNKKANETVIFTMLEAGFAHKRVLEEISHILNSHYMWIAKINDERFNKNLWQAIAADDLFKANNLVHNKTLELLNEDLNKIVSIEVEGKVLERKLEVVLFEIMLFSAQHRAKVEMLFKKFNVQLPQSSYIVFQKLDLVDDF